MEKGIQDAYKNPWPRVRSNSINGAQEIRGAPKPNEGEVLLIFLACARG